MTNVNIHYLKTHIRRQHADEEMKQKIKSQTKTKIKQCLYENYLFKTQKPAQLRQHVESKQEGIIHFRCDYMNCTYGTDNIKSHRRHAKTHQNTKQDNIHKCNQCNFTFPRAISLKARLKKPS